MAICKEVLCNLIASTPWEIDLRSKKRFDVSFDIGPIDVLHSDQGMSPTNEMFKPSDRTAGNEHFYRTNAIDAKSE